MRVRWLKCFFPSSKLILTWPMIVKSYIGSDLLFNMKECSKIPRKPKRAPTEMILPMLPNKCIRKMERKVITPILNPFTNLPVDTMQPKECRINKKVKYRSDNRAVTAEEIHKKKRKESIKSVSPNPIYKSQTLKSPLPLWVFGSSPTWVITPQRVFPSLR